MTGSRSRARRYGLAAKHLLMRARGVVYPDVYSLPYFLTDSFDFVRDGTRLRPGSYDILFAELNRSPEQLRYLRWLQEKGVAPLAVIPGPPELLAEVLDDEMLSLSSAVLREARWVLAYGEEVRAFSDGIAGEQKAEVVPWPFDAEATRRLGGSAGPIADGGPLPLLLTVPLRFSGPSYNHPFVLKSALLDALAPLAPRDRRRFTFHTYTYTAADRDAFRATGFADGWAVRMQPKDGYAAFVRRVGRMAGVVNLTTGGILGRITFLSAALGRPGIFSDNADLNRALYPGSTLPLLDAARLGEAVGSLVTSLAAGTIPTRFLPSAAEVAEIGDYARSRARFREVIARRLG